MRLYIYLESHLSYTVCQGTKECELDKEEVNELDHFGGLPNVCDEMK